MTREEAIRRLEIIIEYSHKNETYQHRISESVWENYGKSRTYFKIIITRTCSKHYNEREYGYIDNKTGEYVPGKNDLTQNYDLRDTRF